MLWFNQNYYISLDHSRRASHWGWMLMEMVNPSINGGNLPFWKLMSLPVLRVRLLLSRESMTYLECHQQHGHWKPHLATLTFGAIVGCYCCRWGLRWLLTLVVEGEGVHMTYLGCHQALRGMNIENSTLNARVLFDLDTLLCKACEPVTINKQKKPRPNGLALALQNPRLGQSLLKANTLAQARLGLYKAWLGWPHSFRPGQQNPTCSNDLWHPTTLAHAPTPAPIPVPVPAHDAAFLHVSYMPFTSAAHGELVSGVWTLLGFAMRHSTLFLFYIVMLVQYIEIK